MVATILVHRPSLLADPVTRGNNCSLVWTNWYVGWRPESANLSTAQLLRWVCVNTCVCVCDVTIRYSAIGWRGCCPNHGLLPTCLIGKPLWRGLFWSPPEMNCRRWAFCVLHPNGIRNRTEQTQHRMRNSLLKVFCRIDWTGVEPMPRLIERLALHLTSHPITLIHHHKILTEYFHNSSALMKPQISILPAKLIYGDF